MVFTEMKGITFEIARNRQNNRAYYIMKLHGLRRKRWSLWEFAGTQNCGYTNTSKVNCENCIKLLNRGLLRDCKHLHHDNDFIFPQDGAASYTSHRTQQYFEGVAPAFIQKDESLNCNPLEKPKTKIKDVGKRSFLNSFRAVFHLGESEQPAEKLDDPVIICSSRLMAR